MSSVPRRLFFALLFGTSCLGPGFAASLPPSRDIKNLYGDGRLLEFSVSDYRDPRGRQWIHIVCDCESAYRQKIEDVVATLWDFRTMPSAFSRIEAVKLRSDDGTTAMIEQKTGLRLLGYSYLSDLVFRDVLS